MFYVHMQVSTKSIWYLSQARIFVELFKSLSE